MVALYTQVEYIAHIKGEGVSMVEGGNKRIGCYIGLCDYSL